MRSTHTERTHFVVVSNRLPPRGPTGRRQNVGGLVSAVAPAIAERDGIWLGWGGRVDGGGARPPVARLDPNTTPAIAELDLDPDAASLYYAEFCNRTLWPLFHGLVHHLWRDDDAWDAYRAVNEMFSSCIGSLVRPDGVVWVHDYHLFLVAKSLRARGFTGRIGFFLHVPFPPVEVVETLPCHEEILAGLGAFDLVGFHTTRYARNFAAAMTELGGASVEEEVVRARGRSCHFGAFPIAIDAHRFTNPPEGDPEDEVSMLGRLLPQRRLILGVDRLDYTKGIPERLLAFERLLARFPEWRGRIVLVQVCVPSREEVPEYAEQRAKVETLVGHINGEFGDAEWVPVRYLYRSYGHVDLARLYRLADVALVTPLRDGMNLVAKEFVAAQDSLLPGVLVLSRFAGAAEELREALIVNPLHLDAVSKAIDRALRMGPAERRARHAVLSATVRRKTAATWASEFLSALEMGSVLPKGKDDAHARAAGALGPDSLAELEMAAVKADDIRHHR